MGNELYCYRSKNDPGHRVMHCLVGTFIKEVPEESTGVKKMFPVKIQFPANKSRVLYFLTQQEQ
jgi:hypothetical protein